MCQRPQTPAFRSRQYDLTPYTAPKAANVPGLGEVLLLLLLLECCLEYIKPSGQAEPQASAASQATASPNQPIKRQHSGHLIQSLSNELLFSSPTFQIFLFGLSHDAGPTQLRRPMRHMIQISSKKLCLY